MGHEVFSLCLTQALFDSALNTNQACTELVFSQLPHTAYATVTEVIDIIDLTATVAQLDQDFDRFEDVVVRQCHRAGDIVTATESTIDLHTTDTRQVVSVFRIEQPLEECFDCIFGWWLARAHHAIDCDTGRHLIGCFIRAQCLRNVWATIEIVCIQRLNVFDTRRAQRSQGAFYDFVICSSNQLASFSVNDICCNDSTDKEVLGHRDTLNLCGSNIT